MKYKTIFWDSDGTLLFGNESFKCSLIKAFGDSGLTLDEDVSRAFFKSTSSWNFPEVDHSLLNGEGWWQDLLSKVKTFCQEQGVSEDVSCKICDDFRRNVISYDYKVYEDTLEVLDKISSCGVKNYVISNNFPELREVFERLGIDPYIEAYIISADAGFEKPRPEIFEAALKIAGIDSSSEEDLSSCLMVGDNPKSDGVGAENVGMDFFIVHNDVSGLRCFKSLTELAEVLNC